MSRKAIKNTAALKRLKKLHDQPGQRDLLWYHRVGEQVAALHPSESREYGESRIEAIADALGEKTSYGDKFWKARNFFERYTNDDVRYLNEPDPDSDYVLKCSHMIYLLSLDTKGTKQVSRKMPSEQVVVQGTRSSDQSASGAKGARRASISSAGERGVGVASDDRREQPVAPPLPRSVVPGR